ncbi:Plug domain-containing protein [uncultured Kordia sp.]|uniref:Plug domain-containing protein n=1 Tax=uncultured Kordia sp. TaxID=507699 RepID=UPI00261740A3|nr:Plug domain-containing protein [uncultured Kordia sp.]
MKKNYYCFYLLLCISCYAFAQTNVTIRKQYQEYFKASHEETIHIHLNKTSFLVGEEIWFKGYVFDKKDEGISKASTNLYVGLYDEDGKQITKKLIHIRNGLANGNLELDKELNSGTYYIKAATQYMIDKASDAFFIEEITIYGNNPATTLQDNTSKKYDIQFLPEGGHIVKNVENTIAFKAINEEGKGVYVNGIIYDESGNEVTTYESNNYGIGTFNLSPKSNHTYTAKTKFKEEETSEKRLPKVENTGITIQVNAIEKDSVKISVNTNKETLQSIVSKEYSLLIHKDGKARSMPFSFNNTEKVGLTIARSGLFNGVNTITLFDGKVPILERMFFNKKADKHLSVMVKKTATENEYSQFSLYLIKRRSGILEANVSISILPETTEANNPAHNIFSSYYLKPYLRGEIENPKYYFPNTTKTKRKALDALLITQGWSKYDWTTIFQNTPKKQVIAQGITIKGAVNFPTKGVRGVFLYDTRELPAQYIPIDKERKFVIQNVYPQADEQLRFSYINNKEEFLQPKLYLTYSANAKEDVIPENTIVDRSFLNKNNMFILPNGFFPKDAEALDAVLLEGSNEKEEKNIDPMMVNAKEIKIGVDEYLHYPQVKNIIENSGYAVADDPFDIGNLLIFTRNRRTLQAGDPPGTTSPLIFLDNAPLSDFSILRNFSTANVERVVINKTGQGYGMRGIGGVIKIYSRKTPLTPTTTTKRESFVSYTPPIGYSVAKQYYEPKYRSFTDDTFQKYGAIDWRPNNLIPRRGPFNFTVKHKNIKAITMFIEGISKDGSLISEKRTITIQKENE